MPDEPTPSSVGNTQAVAPTSTPTQAVTSTTNTTPDTQAVDGNEQFSLEEARKLRKENQALRARQKIIDDAEEQKRLAALSDVERTNKQLADAKAEADKYKQQAVNLHVKLAAKEKGFLNPDIVSAAIASQLEFDKETGLPTNLDDVLDRLLKSDPYLAKPAEPAGQQQQQRPTPQFTANNPGRAGIVQPGNQPLSPKDWPKLGSGTIFPNKG
jgi:hypothetical protein